MLLKYIFGNETAGRVLIYLYHYNEGYPAGISKDLGIPVTPVLKQLERFEKSGVLTSKEIGRVRLYKFNERSPLTSSVKGIISVLYDGLSIEQREKMFSKRRRSRAKGKPVL